jgi:hypothetical protein
MGNGPGSFYIERQVIVNTIPSPKISEMRAVEYDTFFTDQGEKRKGNNRSCQR